MTSYQEKRHALKGSGCKPLASDVRNVLRSGIAITSVVQCVEELVYNAIDAEATTISITVDLESFRVKVEDNGVGLSKSDFDVIGRRHTTSKCSTVADLNNLHYFGYRGEALASIIDLSAGVELYTRTSAQGSVQPYYRKFKNGQPSGTTHQVSDSKRPSPGLTVTVHNLLAKLPVRQKRIDSNLEAEDIKKSLEQIYIISPQLLLCLEVNGRRIFYTYPVKSVSEGFKQTFPKLRESTINECFFNYDCFFFQGWFSRETHHSKSLQYVYVNKRFVGRCRIHRAIDLDLAEVIGVGSAASKSNKIYSKGKDGNRASPRAVDKYPVFILSIQAPYTEYDMTFEPKKSLVEFRNWPTLLKGLEGIVLKLKTELAAENKGVVVKGSAGTGAGRQKLIKKSSEGEPGNAATIHDMKRAVYSRVARRERGPGSPVFDSEGEDSPLGDTSKGFKPYDPSSDDEEMKSPDSIPIKASKMSQFKPKDKLRLLATTSKTNATDLKGFNKRRKGEEPVIHGYKKIRLINPPEPNAASTLESKTLLQNINQRIPSLRKSAEVVEPVEPRQPWNPHGLSDNRKSELRSQFSRLSVSVQDSEYQFEIDEEHNGDDQHGSLHELKQDQVHDLEKARRKSEWDDSDDEKDLPGPGPRNRLDPLLGKDPMVQIVQSIAEDLKPANPIPVSDSYQVFRSVNSKLTQLYNSFVGTSERFQASKVIINAFVSNEAGQKNAVYCTSKTAHHCQLISPSRSTLYLSPEALETIHNWLLYALQYPSNTEYSPVSQSPCVTPLGVSSALHDLERIRDGEFSYSKNSVHESSQENSQELISYSQQEPLKIQGSQAHANPPAFSQRETQQQAHVLVQPSQSHSNLPNFFQHTQQVQPTQHHPNSSSLLQREALQTQTQNLQPQRRPNPPLPPKDIFDFTCPLNFTLPISAPTPAPFRTRPPPFTREPDGFIVQQADQNIRPRTSLSTQQPGLEPLRRLPESSTQQTGWPFFSQPLPPISGSSAELTTSLASSFGMDKFLRPAAPLINMNRTEPQSCNMSSENFLPVFPGGEVESGHFKALYSTGNQPDASRRTSGLSNDNNLQYFCGSTRQSTSFDFPPHETMRQSSGYGTMDDSGLDIQERSYLESSPLPLPPNIILNPFSENKPMAKFELTPVPIFNGETNDSAIDKETEGNEERPSPEIETMQEESQTDSVGRLSTYFQDNMKLDPKPFTFSTISPRNGLPPLHPFKPNSDLNGEWSDEQIFNTSTSWTNWECQVTTDAVGQEWLVTEDKEGYKMYINLKTGVSSYDMRTQLEPRRLTAKEASQINPNFSYNWLRRYFPKGSKFWKPENNHLLKNGNIELAKSGNTILGLGIQQCLNGTVDEAMASKWRDGVLMEAEKAGSSRDTGIVRVAEYWERPLGSGEVPVVNLNAPEVHFWKSITNSCRFTKSDLKNVKVLAQVDKKFIVARARIASGPDSESELLVLFDQHAVHERIRLEMLMTEIYIETSPGIKEISSVCIAPPIQLGFSDTEVRIMSIYMKDFEGIGIKFKRIDSTSVNILSAPKCFAEKIGNEIKSTRDESISKLIYNLIQEKVHHIIDTKGPAQTMPKSIFNILCSQACRGAIKFGDELTLEACKELIDKLKDCKMPFQCAHGRPVLTPLLDLSSIQPTETYSCS